MNARSFSFEYMGYLCRSVGMGHKYTFTWPGAGRVNVGGRRPVPGGGHLSRGGSPGGRRGVSKLSGQGGHRARPALILTRTPSPGSGGLGAVLFLLRQRHRHSPMPSGIPNERERRPLSFTARQGLSFMLSWALGSRLLARLC